MKKVLLLALATIMMVGCDIRNSDGTYTPFAEIRTYVIDSCEYIGGLNNATFIAHKGNCKYCAERRKQELKELVKQLKDN